MTAWTREAIASLREDDFSRTVLVPLFQAMGYRDVRFFGGGALEQGKDIVMWRDEPVRGRVNIAVVVKAVPITGEAVTGRVIDQLRQAFGKPFLDTATHVEQQVSECFVVTPAEVKKEGTNTLQGLLVNERFSDRVTVIDGNKLWEHIEHYMGSRLVIPKLLEAYQELRAAAPSHGINVSLANETVEFRVSGPNPAGEGALIQPAFPATPAGDLARAEYDRFVRTGEPVAIPLAGVMGIPTPEFLDVLGVDTSGGIVKLANVRPRGLVGTLRLVSRDGETAVFQHIEFSVTAGAEQIRFSNANQALPFTISMTVRFGNDQHLSANIQYSSNAVGWSAHWLELQQKALRVMSKGCQFILKDLQTGIEHHFGTAGAGLVEPSTREFILLAEHVAWIEDRVKEPILIPERSFFTRGDRDNIDFVRTVLSKAQYALSNIAFEIQPETQHLGRWVGLLRRGRGTLRLEHETSSWPVLDTAIHLGPMNIDATAASVVTDVPVDEAIRVVERGDAVRVRLEKGAKHRMIARFPRWQKRR